ncbi:MAG TPA: hypothetical protein VGU71_14390 [Candidatus Dormibacteraeota bacterium]|nr:hypothetical protein [Candidatus Dormibacteraeota bacterium]
MTGPWTRDEASASGQVFEFRLWAALTEQSRGGLHVFLPLSDRGIDALVHRLSDGTYFRVQAKGRSALVGGEVHLVVWAVGLVDDDALLVSGLVVDGGLGPTVLVVPVRDFKRLADQTSADGEAVYSMGFGMRPRSDSRWLPFLVPLERLGVRFGVVVPPVSLGEVVVAPRPSWRSDLGFLGESEVVRLLAEGSDLNLFRPFPDLETAELAVLHLESRRVLGLQIKTVGIESGRPSATVSVLASSFRPAPNTYFVVLAWLRAEGRFHDEYLLIPSDEVRGIAAEDEYGHLKFEFHPGSATEGRIDRFRLQLSSLLAAIKGLLPGQRLGQSDEPSIS